VRSTVLRRAILLTILIFSFVFGAGLPEEIQPRVSVKVKADEGVAGRIESYVKRELRKLGDVIVTDSTPDWEILILAIEMKTEDIKLGVAMSIVILQHYRDNIALHVLEKEKVDSNLIDYIKADYRRLSMFKKQVLRFSTYDGLEETCEDIVANFDTEYLEPGRQAYFDVLDILKKYENDSTHKRSKK